MNLLRQGKQDEARDPALSTIPNMKPLPADEKNPLADKAKPEDVIVWLAYKEAKALIGFEDPAATAEQVQK